MNYASHVTNIPQTEPIPGTVKNSGGGYSFGIDPFTQLNRFLILGSEGGSYYANERKLTQENAKAVLTCIAKDGPEVVRRVKDVSVSGRAPKNDPAIFVLALCCAHGNELTKKMAYDAISDVCRIGTHLFTFVQAVKSLRGWSRGLRKGVARFYEPGTKSRLEELNSLAYELIKYRQRAGWTHRDVLRLCHVKEGDGQRNELLKWAVGKAKFVEDFETPQEMVHPIVYAFETLRTTTSDKGAATLIRDHNLPREAVPTELLNSKVVWEALLERMPMTAMIRNLGKMTAIGLLNSNFDEQVKMIKEKLTDLELLKKARIHPLSLLVALKTYSQGHGEKGSLCWSPVPSLIEALDESFYLSFGAVQPTNQNWLLGLDVSSSMRGAQISGTPLDCRTASAAMAMLVARTEPSHEFVAFSNQLVKFEVKKTDPLDTVIQKMDRVSFGSTNCAAPMEHALQKNLPVDVFAVYTDSETNSHGSGHASDVLKQYRKKSGRNAKLMVVGMCSNGFSIADPKDPGMLDVVGFDLATPQIMSEFALGNI